MQVIIHTVAIISVKGKCQNKRKRGIKMSVKEISLINEARPMPVFENVHWDERDLFLTHPETSWRCSFEMFDEGMKLAEPLEIAGFDRVDIINGETGKILRRDCGSGDFIYESPVSGHSGTVGSYVLGPKVVMSNEEYLGLQRSHPCCLIRNLVFSNNVVDMVVGKFICPMKPSDEENNVILKNVSCRFSDKIKNLSFEEKEGLVRRHPDLRFGSIDCSRISITKEKCPDAGTLYCSEALKEAFDNGKTVEGVLIRMKVVDKNHGLSSGTVRCEATVEGCNRFSANREWAELSKSSGVADAEGGFTFDTVAVLWASKEEADKEWGDFRVDDLNAILRLKISNGFATETLRGDVEEFGVDFGFGGFGYSPDTGRSGGPERF